MASPTEPRDPSDKLVTIIDDKYPGVILIAEYARKQWPDVITAKETARHTGLAYGTVRNLLPKAELAGRLRKVGHGQYTIPSPDGVPELRVENIVLVRSARSENDNARPHGGGRVIRRQTRVDVQERRSAMPGFAGARKLERRLFFRTWSVYIQEFDNGTIEMQIGAQGGAGMTVWDLGQFGGWLMGMYPEIPDEGPTGWHVRMYELNRDYKNLRIDGLTNGARSVSFRMFKDVLVKAYQKEGALRVEVRHDNINFPISQLFAAAEESFMRVAKRSGWLVDAAEVREDHA